MNYQFFGCKFSLSLITFIKFIKISINFRYTSTMIFFCPRRYFSKVIRKHFSALMLTFSFGATLASLVNPVVNAFALMCLVIPTFYLLFKELDRIKQKDNKDSKKIYELGIRTVVILIFAIITWINDRAFCDFYTEIRVTYLHAVWHVLIFLWVFFNKRNFIQSITFSSFQIVLHFMRIVRLLFRWFREARLRFPTFLLATKRAELHRNSLHWNQTPKIVEWLNLRTRIYSIFRFLESKFNENRKN